MDRLHVAYHVGNEPTVDRRVFYVAEESSGSDPMIRQEIVISAQVRP